MEKNARLVNHYFKAFNTLACIKCVPCTRNCAKQLTCMTSLSPLNHPTDIHILQVRELKSSEV